MQHGCAAPPIRGPATHRPRLRNPGDTGAVHRAGLADGGLPLPESFHDRLPPRHGHHAQGISNRDFERRPARPGRRV